MTAATVAPAEAPAPYEVGTIRRDLGLDPAARRLALTNADRLREYARRLALEAADVIGQDPGGREIDTAADYLARAVRALRDAAVLDFGGATLTDADRVEIVRRLRGAGI